MSVLDDIEKLILKNAAPDEIKKYEDTKKAFAYASDALKKIESPLNVGNYLISLALDRVEPIDVEGIVALFGAAVLDDKLTSFMTESRDWLKSLPHEDISIISVDGLKLIGHIVTAPRQKRIIVAAHGWRSEWNRDFCFCAKYFYEHGITVLYIEQRAQGNSEGDCMSFGVFEHFDLIDWMLFAVDKFGKKLPIYLMGVSMGAASAMMCASYKFPPNVKGIIADCGYTSIEGIWKHVAVDCLHIPYPKEILTKLCLRKIHIDPAEHSTIDALHKATLPMLFIHGTGDSFVPVENTIQNYEACSSEKMIMLVPGAEHGLSSYNDPDRYRKTLEKFFSLCEHKRYAFFKML